jgi:hypothetical protein
MCHNLLLHTYDKRTSINVFLLCAHVALEGILWNNWYLCWKCLFMYEYPKQPVAESSDVVKMPFFELALSAFHDRVSQRVFVTV